MRLLIFEGECPLVDEVTAALLSAGCDVAPHRCRERLEFAALNEPFDAVVVFADDRTDTGLGFVRSARESLQIEAPILVVCSEHTDPASIRTYLDAGASEFLTWPEESDRIRSRIASAGVRSDFRPLTGSSILDLLEAVPDPIIVVDASGSIVLANSRAERLTGYSRTELAGRSIELLVPTDLRDTHRDHRRRFSQNPAHRMLELEMLKADGSIIPAEISLSPFDRAGEAWSIASIRDRSDRIRVDMERRASDERLRVALAAAHMGTWDWDLASGVLTWSDETELIVGRTPGTNSYDYATFLSVVHPDDRERIDRRVQDTIAHGNDYLEEYRVILPDGSVIWSQAAGGIVRDASGQPARLVGVTSDITKRREAENELREGEERFRGAFENAAIGMALVGIEGSFLRVNPALCRMLGYDEAELLAQRFQDITHPDDLAEDRALVSAMLSGDLDTYQMVKRYLRKDGAMVWAQLSSTLVHAEDKSPLYFVSQIADITERRHAQAALAEAYAEIDRVVNGISDCLYSAEVGPDGTYTYSYLSSVAGKLLARPANYVAENPTRWAEIIHPEDLPVLQQSLSNLLLGTATDLNSEFRIIWPDRRVRWLRDNTVVTRLADGSLRLDGILTDITERKEFELELEHQALHDALTGLPNRVLFNDRLTHALARRHRSGRVVAVLFLDLDRFKTVNDGLGHEIGDELLSHVARRLAAHIRPGDTVARFGGDEFVVLAEDIESPHDATGIAERLIAVLSEPIQVGGRQVYTGVSIGITLAGDAITNPNEMLRNADAALYRAKAAGRGRYAMFDPRMGMEALARLETEELLRRALESNAGLLLHYQPILEMTGGEIVAIESLVRWQLPDGSMLAPDAFIPLAEETGLITALDNWVLTETCRQIRAWESEFPEVRKVHLSVNLSPRRCHDPAVVNQIAHIMRAEGISLHRLTLEITERVLVEEEAHRTVQALKEAGVKLAIDDFGTGYSSLGYLGRIGVDFLKIDRQFIDGMMLDERQSAIVEAILALGHSLGLQVTAEGIETEEQFRELRRLGCDHGQGYLLARPLSAEQFGDQLAGGSLFRPLSERAPALIGA